MSIIDTDHRCDEPWGLKIADGSGAVRCWQHMTEAEHELAADLDRQAAAYGVIQDRWPYGPNVYLDMRQLMIAWAADRGLKLAHPGCVCPFWLLSGQCGRCHGTWLDHPTAWHAGRKQGRVLVAHTYGIAPETSYLCSMAADGFDVRVSPPLGGDAQDDAASAEMAASGVRILPPGGSWYWPERTSLIEARGTQAARDRYAEVNRQRR